MDAVISRYDQAANSFLVSPADQTLAEESHGIVEKRFLHQSQPNYIFLPIDLVNHAIVVVICIQPLHDPHWPLSVFFGFDIAEVYACHTVTSLPQHVRERICKIIERFYPQVTIDVSQGIAESITWRQLPVPCNDSAAQLPQQTLEICSPYVADLVSNKDAVPTLPSPQRIQPLATHSRASITNGPGNEHVTQKPSGLSQKSGKAAVSNSERLFNKINKGIKKIKEYQGKDNSIVPYLSTGVPEGGFIMLPSRRQTDPDKPYNDIRRSFLEDGDRYKGSKEISSLLVWLSNLNAGGIDSIWESLPARKVGNTQVHDEDTRSRVTRKRQSDFARLIHAIVYRYWKRKSTTVDEYALFKARHIYAALGVMNYSFSFSSQPSLAQYDDIASEVVEKLSNVDLLVMDQQKVQLFDPVQAISDRASYDLVFDRLLKGNSNELAQATKKFNEGKFNEGKFNEGKFNEGKSNENRGTTRSSCDVGTSDSDEASSASTACPSRPSSLLEVSHSHQYATPLSPPPSPSDNTATPAIQDRAGMGLTDVAIPNTPQDVGTQTTRTEYPEGPTSGSTNGGGIKDDGLNKQSNHSMYANAFLPAGKDHFLPSLEVDESPFLKPLEIDISAMP